MQLPLPQAQGQRRMSQSPALSEEAEAGRGAQEVPGDSTGLRAAAATVRSWGRGSQAPPHGQPS